MLGSWKCHLLLVPHYKHCSQVHYQKFVESLELSLLLLLKVFLYEHDLQLSRFRGMFGILMLLDAFLQYLLFFGILIHK